MKKRFISLLLLVCMAFCSLGTLAGCNPDTSSSPEPIDYVAQTTLDLNSNSIKQEVTVKTHIDGDTTHFYVPNGANVPAEVSELGYLKARYLGVNTPESTGTIEPWGSTASNFTKEKLTGADSIILETDTSEWEFDANGRYLVWVWYRTAGTSVYRNLNVELLQNGLAVGSKTVDVRYGTTCTAAIAQAKAQALCVFSKDPDPNFYYGTAVELDLKELRTNIDDYVGKRVAFEGTVCLRADEYTIYVEDYDEETDMYFGITIFYGYYREYHDILAVGNRVRIVGDLTNHESFGYQISNLKYNVMRPTDADNIQMLVANQKIAFTETTIEKFNSTVTIALEDEEETTASYPYAQLALHTSVSMKDLTVTSVYTTHNGGDNDGAMTLTCKDASGKTITVRTEVLYNPDKTMVTANQFQGKKIDVLRGIVDSYDGSYQIRIFSLGAVAIH